MSTKNIISDTVKHLPLITRSLLMLATAAIIPLLFPSEGKGDHYDYAEGGIWRSNDLVAPHDFTVVRPQAEVDREVEEARNNLLLYYHYDNSAYNRALERVNTLAGSYPESRIRQMQRKIDSIYRVGYMEMPSDVPNFKQHDVVILEGNVGSQHSVGDYVCPLDVRDSLLREQVLVPSIVYDRNRTKLELDSRLSQLETSNGMVRQGELIIAKGELVTPEKAQIVRSLEQDNDRRYQQHYHPVGRYIGQAALCLFALVALFLFMRNTRHPILEDASKVTFIMVLIIIVSAMTALVQYINADWVLIVPLCVVPIMMRVFFDMRVALYVHVTTVIILANMVANPFEFIFYQLIAGMMTIVTVRNFEERSKFFLVAGVIFLSYSLIYTFGVLSQESTLESITADRYLVFFLNALLSLLAYPLIYLFERVFGLTTNLTLMELSSTNTPALRELSRNAPGTFQHSMQVANICEDLMNEIGGNALLAKVGALYHDIGKLQAPLYFTENQNSEFNPHDELDNLESAAIIISHVPDGIELAKHYHLPTAVQDFIRTHHGTTYTGYFYAKEMERHPDGDFDAALFRYPGPRPYSRETAVVMIVDTVEAACRSLKQHTKENTDTLIDKLIDSKIESKQLDNCPLSLGDIAKIRKFLKEKMMSIYHVRVEYPTANGNA